MDYLGIRLAGLTGGVGEWVVWLRSPAGAIAPFCPALVLGGEVPPCLKIV